MLSTLRKHLIYLWKKDTKRSRSIIDWLLFFVLCCCEYVYVIGFFLHQSWRKKQFCKKPFCPTVSIGNIASGGTGKTILCSFIVSLLQDIAPCAVVSKGYGGRAGKLQQPTLVSDGKALFVGPLSAGDEAYMIASRHTVPVVVGANRQKSIALCEEKFAKSVQAIILDDAYQTHNISISLNILLLDAVAPFGNKHCLPAGPLREKDISRADVIIFVHSDKKIMPLDFKLLKKYGLKDKQILLQGRRHCAGIFLDNKYPILPDKAHKVFVVAGIGSFHQFYGSVEVLGELVVGFHEYPDHHPYSLSDCLEMIQEAVASGAIAIVTTEKDWVKISPLIAGNHRNLIAWHVIRVEFEFLTPAEYSTFRNVLMHHVMAPSEGEG